MYYCQKCGHRSQGDTCANPNCKNFRQPFATPSPQNHPPHQDEELSINFRNEIDTPDPSFVARPPSQPNTPQWDLDFGNGDNGRAPDYNRMPSRNHSNPSCNMPNPPCNDELQISFATTPFQRFEDIYTEEKGLMAGTIFRELDMPYAIRKVFGGYNG